MNFLEAVQAMKEGKKVKRGCYDVALCFYDDEIVNMNNKDKIRFFLDHEDFLATDWEVVGEKETLSQKLVYSPNGVRRFNEDDVKEALKEFLEWSDNGVIREKAKEIFGERLI